MNLDEYLRIENRPDLHQPVVLAAFAGWNDASQVATFALTTLIKVWRAKRFAEILPEDFYVFTETRPTISIGRRGRRALQWPANTFYSRALNGHDHDVVVLVGTEPQLRWRAFCRAVTELAQSIDASCLITLGGLLADIPHTIQPRLTGFASEARVLPQLNALGVETSAYEGPTGIVGALHDAWDKTGLPAISLWGNVPHYISASPNPQLALALLQRLESLLGVSLPLGPLEADAQSFQRRIDEALSENPEAMEYVQQLEEHFVDEAPPTPTPELIAELEEFLRTRRPEGDGESDAE